MADDVYVQFHFERRQRARKEHVCQECNRKIPPGEQYITGFGKSEGDTFAFKHCEHCEVLAEWLLRECHGYLHQAIVEDYTDHLRDNVRHYGFGAARLAVLANNNWRTQKGRLVPVPNMPPTTHDKATK